MAITSSTIRIYEDYDLLNLVKTITTQSDIDAIDVISLEEGEVYYATVQVVENGQTSEESGGYRFYTLPDCYFTALPTAVGTTINFETDVITNVVGIDRSGAVCIRTDGTSRAVYTLSDQTPFNSSFENLDEDTFYTIKPCVYDEFGRLWINDDDGQIVKTTSAPPTVAISDLNPTANTLSGTVTVNSNVPITNLVIKLLPQGGGAYIDAVGYSAQSGTQQFTASGLTADTTYTVYATATNMGGSATAEAVFSTMTVTASVTLDDCTLDSSSKTDSVYVEASGTVGSGGTLNVVGVKFFSDNSTSSTLISDTYTQQGVANLVTTVNNLPNGTTMYAFAYMEYEVGGETFVVYSTSQSVTTVPTIAFGQQNITTDSCSGSYTINGTATSMAIEYRDVSIPSWNNATVNQNNYSITNLTPNTYYFLRGTVSNASGTYTVQEQFLTDNASAPSISLTINNVTANGATANLTITE